MQPKKSCAGQAEPNFFHADKTGFEDVEFMFQDSEFGPSLNIGPDFQIFYNANSAQDKSQNPNATNKAGGSWCIIAKNPSALGEIGKDRKPGDPICFMNQKKDQNQDTSGDGTHNFKEIPITVKGKQVRLQVQETKSGGKVTDTKMFLAGDGDARIRLNPEMKKSGKKVSSKMQVDLMNLKTGKIAGRTESSVEGQVKEGAEGVEAYKFSSCKNMLKDGKQAKSSYTVPKYTKDLTGDHHLVGGPMGPNNQFVPEDIDGKHASYRQKTDGTPVTALNNRSPVK